jgi:hypothetical protein
VRQRQYWHWHVLAPVRVYRRHPSSGNRDPGLPPQQHTFAGRLASRGPLILLCGLTRRKPRKTNVKGGRASLFTGRDGEDLARPTGLVRAIAMNIPLLTFRAGEPRLSKPPE